MNIIHLQLKKKPIMEQYKNNMEISMRMVGRDLYNCCHETQMVHTKLFEELLMNIMRRLPL